MCTLLSSNSFTILFFSIFSLLLESNSIFIFLGNNFFAPLLIGLNTIFNDSIIENLTEIIDKHNPKVVFSVPTIYRRLLKDSKTLTKDKREELEKYIKKNSIWAIGQASTKEIEKINILHASLLAMKRAILKLNKKPSLVLIDGNKLPDLKNYKLKYVIKGDQKIPSISAASIIAKVSRDRFITKLSKQFNNYGWDTNSGYGTKQHLRAIKRFGITKHHRITFSPICDLL